MMHSTRTSIGFWFLLFVVFTALKLWGVIAWSWWWVTLPIWLPSSVIVACLVWAVWYTTTALKSKRARSLAPEHLDDPAFPLSQVKTAVETPIKPIKPVKKDQVVMSKNEPKGNRPDIFEKNRKLIDEELKKVQESLDKTAGR